MEGWAVAMSTHELLDNTLFNTSLPTLNNFYHTQKILSVELASDFRNLVII
jgi:hypothetical protein